MRRTAKTSPKQATSALEVLTFLEIHQQLPVLCSACASARNVRRIKIEKIQMGLMTAQAIARHMEKAAADDTRERRAVNVALEREGFVSYRQLLPVMRRLFPDHRGR
ncbi:MAG: hypothetical protein WC429_06295 [Verrucomicrobiia bacterium]|jgi:hypothetical protein